YNLLNTGDRKLSRDGCRYHRRAEVRRRVRFSGDAGHLRGGPGPSRARADALAIQDVQLRVRALPQDAREVSTRELPRTRADVVGERRQELRRRREEPVSEGTDRRRRSDRSL